MDDVEMGQRVRNVVAVLARMKDKVSGRDLDALQQCLRLAESVPGPREDAAPGAAAGPAG